MTDPIFIKYLTDTGFKTCKIQSKNRCKMQGTKMYSNGYMNISKVYLKIEMKKVCIVKTVGNKLYFF